MRLNTSGNAFLGFLLLDLAGSLEAVGNLLVEQVGGWAPCS